jgi:hypothetical protein
MKYKPYDGIPYTPNKNSMEDNHRNRLMMFIGKFSEKCQDNMKAGKTTPPKEQLDEWSLIKWENKNNPKILRIARELIFVAYQSDKRPDATWEELHSEFDKLYDAIPKAETALYTIKDRHIETERVKQREAELRAAIADENEAVLFQLRQSFTVEPCPLGTDPRKVLPEVTPVRHTDVPRQFLTMHHLENYPTTSFLIGIVNGDDHLGWIFSREGGKRDDAYNVRIGKDVPGGVVKSRDAIKHAKFVVLYLAGKETEGVYKAFRVKNIGEMTKDQMVRTGYKVPLHDKYLCYFFDEEITLGNLDIKRIIEDDKKRFFDSIKNNPVYERYPLGRPIYLEGKKLIDYRL